MAQRLTVRLTAFAVLFLLMSATAEAGVCPAAPPPSIEIRTEEGAAAFDTTRTKEELARMRTDDSSPWPSYYHAETGGLMEGKVSLTHKVRYRENTDEASGTGCVWLTKIEVTLRVDPKIYIAREYRDETCWFGEVFAHEAKHVEADRALFADQTLYLIEGLNLLFQDRADYVSGAVPAGEIEARARAMGKTVERALRVLFAGLMERREEKQREIDNLHEYVRISGRC